MSKITKHIINLDDDPSIPEEGWSVVEHSRMGQLEWDPKRIQLYRSPKQESDQGYNGFHVRAELGDQNPLNANLGDYLIKYPHLIPEEWKGKSIYLWGTVFSTPGGGAYYVCYLVWYGGCWHLECSLEDSDFHSDQPAACLAS